jgi:hypothetical protein
MRILLTILLPLVTPFIFYAFWVAWMRRREDAGQPVTRMQANRLVLCFVLGGILAGAALFLTAWIGSSPSDSKYVPPRLENGRIIPGHHE